jgi:16S rRNA (guanine527-N7)-methyltransferase
VTPDEVGAALGVSRETLSDLIAFAEILIRWNAAINLVARSTTSDLWRRHILDCGQLAAFAPDNARQWTDLGSGGGLPALVVALILRELRPEIAVTAVESDARKCAFMADAARALRVSLAIRMERIEAAEPTPSDVVSARALAPLPALLESAVPWLSPGGIALFPKGRNAERELTEASRIWHYHAIKRRSLSDPAASILELSEIRRDRPIGRGD